LLRQMRTWYARAQRGMARQASGIRLIALSALLCVSILGFAFALFRQTGSPAQIQTTTDGWIPLSSTSPSDVIAAATASPLYQTASVSSQTRLGQAIQHGHLGTPQLVRAYHSPGSYDVWVIPLLQGSGGATDTSASVVALFDLEYDQAHQRVRATSFSGPFVAGDPEYGQPFPLISAQVASARFHSYAQSSHIQAPETADMRPQLMYFAAPLSMMTGPHPKIIWHGGGQFPDLAIWRLSDSAGKDYFAGINGEMYTGAQLPLATTGG
jgi:hypothetical protein